MNGLDGKEGIIGGPWLGTRFPFGCLGVSFFDKGCFRLEEGKYAFAIVSILFLFGRDFCCLSLLLDELMMMVPTSLVREEARE